MDRVDTIVLFAEHMMNSWLEHSGCMFPSIAVTVLPVAQTAPSVALGNCFKLAESF